MMKIRFHRKLAQFLAAGVAVLVLTFGASTLALAGQQENIVETAIQAGQFQTLVKAIKAAGLVNTLEGPGPFTVFAPTDEAFAKLPPGTLEMLLKPENKEKLVSILTYHVVPGKLMASQVAGMNSAKTVNGEPLTITTNGGGVMVNSANVVKADIVCSNGVIHVIDEVLLPQ